MHWIYLYIYTTPILYIKPILLYKTVDSIQNCHYWIHPNTITLWFLNMSTLRTHSEAKPSIPLVLPETHHVISLIPAWCWYNTLAYLLSAFPVCLKHLPHDMHKAKHMYHCTILIGKTGGLHHGYLQDKRVCIMEVAGQSATSCIMHHHNICLDMSRLNGMNICTN